MLEQLLNQRTQLMEEVNKLKETDILAAKNKLKEVKELNNKIKEIKEFESEIEAENKEIANQKALNNENSKVINIANKSVNVNGEVIDNMNSTNTAKNEKEIYEMAFAKNMLGQALDKDETNVFNSINDKFRNETQTAATHTILVPETVKEGIWKEIGELHPIFGDINATGIKGDITIIKEENEMSNAEWVDEKTKSTDDEVAFGELNLTGCELVKSIKISWKLKKMAINSFLPYITIKLAEKMAYAVAHGVIRGKGKPGISDEFKPQAKGVITVLEAESSKPQVTEYTDKISYEALTTAMSKIKGGYAAGACFYANNTTIWTELAHITDATGKPMFIADVMSGGVGRLFGKVVKEEDGMNDGELLLANMGKGYVANINESMSIYTEDHIKERATEYMGYAILDGDVLTSKAFSYMKKSE